MTTQRWWLRSETARSSTQCSSWTLTSTTKVLVSTAAGSSSGLSKTWTLASGNSTPGSSCLQRQYLVEGFTCWDLVGELFLQALCCKREARGSVSKAVQPVESHKTDLWVRHRTLQPESRQNCDDAGQRKWSRSGLQGVAHSVRHREVLLV